MPTYEYRCTSCGNHIDVFQRIDEEPLRTCTECGGELRKVFHPAGIVFKGSGFYATDSRRSTKSGEKKDSSEKKTEKQPEKKSETKGDSKPAEKKPAGSETSS